MTGPSPDNGEWMTTHTRVDAVLVNEYGNPTTWEQPGRISYDIADAGVPDDVRHGQLPGVYDTAISAWPLWAAGAQLVKRVAEDPEERSVIIKGIPPHNLPHLGALVQDQIMVDEHIHLPSTAPQPHQSVYDELLSPGVRKLKLYQNDTFWLRSIGEDRVWPMYRDETEKPHGLALHDYVDGHMANMLFMGAELQDSITAVASIGYQDRSEEPNDHKNYVIRPYDAPARRMGAISVIDLVTDNFFYVGFMNTLVTSDDPDKLLASAKAKLLYAESHNGHLQDKSLVPMQAFIAASCYLQQYVMEHAGHTPTEKDRLERTEVVLDSALRVAKKIKG